MNIPGNNNLCPINLLTSGFCSQINTDLSASNAIPTISILQHPVTSEHLFLDNPSYLIEYL